MEDEVKAIIAFVQERVKTGNPPQYGDIRKHFHWSQTKWSKYWKKAKEFLDWRKPSTGGYPLYWVKQHYREEAEKTLFAIKLNKTVNLGKLHEVEISQERMDDIKNKLANDWVSSLGFEPARTKSFKKKVEDYVTQFQQKRISKDDLGLISIGAFFHILHEEEESLRGKMKKEFGTFSDLVKIRIITEKGESTPILADKYLKEIFLMLLDNSTDPNTYRFRRSLHIMASLELPKEWYPHLEKASKYMKQHI